MDSLELRNYISPLKRWWWLILAATLLAGGSAFVYSRLQPSLYQSHMTLVVGSSIQDPNPNSAEFSLTQMLAGAYADIAQRNSVRQATMQALGMQLLPKYTVAVGLGSSILEISVTDVDPERAQVVANELGNQLMLLSPAGREVQTRDQFLKDQIAKLEANIKATEDEIARKQEDLAKELSASKIRQFEDQIHTLETKLASMQANYAALLINTQKGAVNAINILEPASLPDSPLTTGQTQSILLAAMLGAALAIGGIYLIEFLDDCFRNVDQIHEKLGLTTLGTVPLVPEPAGKAQRLIMLEQQHSVASEAFRVLRTNLQFASVDRPLVLLQVTSPATGDGKSSIAANIAVAIAQAGRQVVLIDADLRKPMLHRFFGLVNNVGVTTALLGEYKALEDVLQSTAVANLRVMASGPLPPNPSELLGSRRMQDLFRELRSQCDIVIVDSPPVTAVSDTTVVAGAADGVLLVIRAGRTRRDAAKHALAALHQVRAPVLGVVLNAVDERHGYHYTYDAEYGSSYYRNKAHVAKRTHRPAQEPARARQIVEPVAQSTNGDGKSAKEGATVPPSTQQKS